MNPENSLKLPGEPEAAAASSGQPRLIRFDRYMLDLRRGTLRSGEDDIEIRPKTFEVLKLLVENAGRLVSKDEIVATVWPGVFVTDDSVVQCVKELRRALGPDGERLVRTVPRRGYRLEADGPTNLSATPPDSDARRADEWRADRPPRSMAGAALAAADGRLGGLDAADMQRVTAIAAENKFIIPSFVINRPAANVPPQLRRYSGIWASKIAFNGGAGRQAMLIVTDVESDGTIMGYFVYGPPTPQSAEQNPTGFAQWRGKVSDGVLTYPFAFGTTMTVQFTGDDIFVVQNRTDGFRPTVTMEPVWRPADEEADGPTDLSATPPDSDERRADGPPGSMAGTAPRRLRGHLGLAVAAGVAALLAICLFSDLIIQRALPQAGKPAIAVLPFMSAGEDGDRFADGMTDDIINALGRFSSLTVMSHSAVALYKHRSATPQQVGRDLAVQYVLEGSVRRLGDQLRVTAELADTDRGEILWSGRFDETPDGVFDVQDRITTKVVGSLAVKVTQVDQAAAPATESPKSASPKPTSHQSASPASPLAGIAMRDALAAPVTNPAAADGRLAGLDEADMQRVTAIAAENQLIIPSFVINRPAANVPPQLRRYSGIWASKIAFNGGAGRHAMLIVTDVEGDGTIMGYFVYGPSTPQTVEQNPAGFVRWLGKVSDGALTYRYGLGTMIVQLTGDNIFLAQNRADGRRATVTMEPVWRPAGGERAAAR
jgi:TolB-like protein/DNA-binding winged helix-turn-helix (wHTH) protein